MAKFKAKVLVTYVIDAEDISDAVLIARFNTEFPIVPHNDGYCLSDELFSIERVIADDNEQVHDL